MDEELRKSNSNLFCFFFVLFQYSREAQSDTVRRSSRIRKNIVQNENILPFEEKQKKKTTKNTNENRTHPAPKIKLVSK